MILDTQFDTRIPKTTKPATEAGFVNATVGRTGFEPATPWSQTTYSTGLNYLPKSILLSSRNLLIPLFFILFSKLTASALSPQSKLHTIIHGLPFDVNFWYPLLCRSNLSSMSFRATNI